MLRHGRFNIANSDGIDCANADGNVVGIACQHCVWWIIDLDLEFHERDELYCVGRLDGHQSDVRHTEHGCADGQWHLYIELFGHRWFRIAVGDRDDCAGADRDLECVADDRRRARFVDVDVEFDECNEL